MRRWFKVLILNFAFLFTLGFHTIKDERKRMNGLLATAMLIGGTIGIVAGVFLLLLSVENTSPYQYIMNGIIFFVLGLSIQLFLGPKVR